VFLRSILLFRGIASTPMRSGQVQAALRSWQKRPSRGDAISCLRIRLAARNHGSSADGICRSAGK
jgi:hypothetical protein